MAEGHRSRLRQRLLNEDIDEIPEYVVLEMMLTAAVRQRDMGDIARELIKRFGSFAQVIDAPVEELLKVKGVGETMVAHIKLMPKLYRKYRLSRWKEEKIITCTSDAGDLLLDEFIGRDYETVFIICMDVNGRVLAIRKAFEGNVNAVHVSIRKITDIALHFNSARVIIAHNHVGGNALPSNEDIKTTDKIRETLSMVGIRLDDHIIVADDDYVSISDSEKLKIQEV